MTMRAGAAPPGHHLLLGGSGFIGRHVAVRLAQAGHSVVLADRVAPAHSMPEELRDRITWRAVEFGSADWDALVAEAAVVHHYAWTSLPASANANPLGDLSMNVMATIALLEALRRRGGGRVLFASSGGTVYGRLTQVPVPEQHRLAPITAYGAGKAAAELYFGLYRALHGLDCRIARLANPYGAGQDLARGQGAVTTFLHRALTGQPIVIWGDGEVVRDYIHIADAVAALVAFAAAPDAGPMATINIGSGEGVSLNRIVSALEQRFGRTLEARREPGRSFDVPVSVLDIGLARRLLDWVPRLSFDAGVDRTLADLAAGRALSTLD